MADKEINITFETLFEILRTEKNREELQRLPETFFGDFKAYFQEKQSIIRSLKSRGEEADEGQIGNITRMMRELYEAREHKLIKLAIHQSRSSEAIDTGNLLPSEKRLFSSLSRILVDYKKEVLDQLMTETPKEAPSPARPALVREEPPTELKVTFTSDIPKFLDRERTVHGPFAKGDQASLPPEIANILIRKGKAKP